MNNLIKDKISELIKKFIKNPIIIVDDSATDISISIGYDDEIFDFTELNKKIRDTFHNHNCKIIYLPRKNCKIDESPKPITRNFKPSNSKSKIPQVKKIILIASGKGGVGKSTISANLAIALNQLGWRTGLLDADIYGASIPTIFGITNYEIDLNEDDMMIPRVEKDISINSIEFIAKNDEALVWRGPMISKVLHQLLKNTRWEELDYLIVDTPPGTGDIHLTLVENYHIDGYVLVSTPHQIALNNSNKTQQMMKKFSVPNLGFVLNMYGDIFPMGDSKIESDIVFRIPFIKSNADSLFALKTEHLKYFVEIARSVVQNT